MRCMYSRFLREAAEVLDKSALTNAADIFDEEVKAIRELELTMLPDDFPNMAEIRRILIETNQIQESMHTDYRQRLHELDERLKKSVTGSIHDDYVKYSTQIPKVQVAIQRVHDLESKAWEEIRSARVKD